MSAAQEEELNKAKRPRRRETARWVHHVADLDRDIEVATSEYHRPIPLYRRIETVSAFVSDSVNEGQWPSMLLAPERRLSPRTPYQSAPLSYINTATPNWALFAESDSLDWVARARPASGDGEVEFWFRNVTVGTTALTTIRAKAASTQQGVTGTMELRSSDATPRSFAITGYADYIFDLIVRPRAAFAVLVIARTGEGVGSFSLREVTYSTL